MNVLFLFQTHYCGRTKANKNVFETLNTTKFGFVRRQLSNQPNTKIETSVFFLV